MDSRGDELDRLGFALTVPFAVAVECLSLGFPVGFAIVRALSPPSDMSGFPMLFAALVFGAGVACVGFLGSTYLLWWRLLGDRESLGHSLVTLLAGACASGAVWVVTYPRMDLPVLANLRVLGGGVVLWRKKGSRR